MFHRFTLTIAMALLLTALSGMTHAVDKGFVASHGTKYIWTGTGEAFVPNFVMYGPNAATPLNEITEEEYDQFLDEMIDGHGFNGVHHQVYGQWFNIGTMTVGNDHTIDPRTFDKLEMMIKKVHARGAVVHLWMWGDAQRKLVPPNTTSSTLSQAEKNVCDAIYERLNHLPGWTLGYGFDLWEWTNSAHLKAWHDYLHAKPGWKHLLCARSHKNQVNQIYGGLDVSSYETHKPDYAEYRRMVNHHDSKPSFSADRFRIRGRDKDVTPELTRQMLWWATMAGGVAGIWGNLGSESGVSHTYPNREEILCYNLFWHNGKRFRKDMVVDNDLSNGYVLRDGSSHYVFFKENTNSIQIEFSGSSKRVIAVNAKAAYQEIDLGTMAPGSHTLNLPSSSDWAIAVGDFAASTDPNNDPPTIDSLSVSDSEIDGDSAQVFVDASDPEGDSLTYTWQAMPSDGVSIGNGEDPTVTFSAAGVYAFSVAVSDESNAPVSSDTVTITVNQVPSSLQIQP